MALRWRVILGIIEGMGCIFRLGLVVKISGGVLERITMGLKANRMRFKRVYTYKRGNSLIDAKFKEKGRESVADD
jgi:hypothetical protein